MCVPGCQEAIHRALSRRRRASATAAAFAATAVAPPAAWPRRGRSRRVVDLTHTMSADFPTFDGTPGIEMQQAHGPQEGRLQSLPLAPERAFRHASRRADPFFRERHRGRSRFPPTTLVVPLAVINVADKAAKNPDYQLSRADLAAWERRHGRLPDNCCVAMNSGWARHVVDKAKYVGKDAGGVMHFPGIDPDAAAWLLKQRKVAGLAVDTLSLDHGASKDFKTHVSWLGGGTLGPRECRQPRQRAGGRRDAGRRAWRR